MRHMNTLECLTKCMRACPVCGKFFWRHSHITEKNHIDGGDVHITPLRPLAAVLSLIRESNEKEYFSSTCSAIAPLCDESRTTIINECKPGGLYGRRRRLKKASTCEGHMTKAGKIKLKWKRKSEISRQIKDTMQRKKKQNSNSKYE